jgi:hypothetical protein
VGKRDVMTVITSHGAGNNFDFERFALYVCTRYSYSIISAVCWNYSAISLIITTRKLLSHCRLCAQRKVGLAVVHNRASSSQHYKQTQTFAKIYGRFYPDPQSLTEQLRSHHQPFRYSGTPFIQNCHPSRYLPSSKSTILVTVKSLCMPCL